MLDSVSHLLPGLLPASFRGVSFFVPDASTEPGRRVAEHLFPGVDRAAYDDLGLLPAIVTIDGLMVGDDYVVQAKALEAAFERPGPGTLVHPWLGAMTVIVVDPPEISFSATELRVARFTASFTRIRTGASRSPGISTAAALLGAVRSLVSSALALASAPETLTLSQARSLATQRSSRILRSEWLGLPSGRAAQAISSALPAGPAISPSAYAGVIGAVSSALLDTVPAIAGVSAVGPAAGSSSSLALSPARALDLFLTASNRFGALLDDAPSPADRAMLLAASAEPASQAARLSAYVEHASREDALTLRGRLVDALDATAEAAGALDGTDFAAFSGELRRSAEDLRARVVADINETVGRLPALTVLTTTRQADAWQIANHLYGDSPETIEAGYGSIVSRNRPRHPAMLPAGRIEALKP